MAAPRSRRALWLLVWCHARVASFVTARAFPNADVDRSHALRHYLQAVYPAGARSLEGASVATMRALFESLDYYYSADPRRTTQFLPQDKHILEPLSSRYGAGGMAPPLPYLPRGAYFTVEAMRPGRAVDWQARGKFDRWQRPVRVHAEPARSTLFLHASVASKVGPAPSWTNPLAIVRAVWFPVGFDPSDVRRRVKLPRRQAAANSSEAPGRLVLDDARTAPYGGALRRLRSLRALRDGDHIEVEQWGGPQIRDCPPTCGLWANVWRGTGTFLRVRTPFVSLSKATAIIEMLAEIGAREAGPAGAGDADGGGSARGAGLAARLGPRLRAVVASTGVAEGVERLLARFPDASPAEAVGTALFFGDRRMRDGPCPIAGGYGDQDGGQPVRRAYESARWVQRAHAYAAHPAEVVSRMLLRHPRGGAAEESSQPPSTEADELAVFWLHGLCGKSPLQRANATVWAAWDAMLAQLACFLGVQTVVLGASPNDNGLLHQELVDFDGPPGHAWARIHARGHGAPLNGLDECVSPFGRHRPGPSAEQLREHWKLTGKFTLRDPLGGAGPAAARRDAEAPSLPCVVYNDSSPWAEPSPAGRHRFDGLGASRAGGGAGGARGKGAPGADGEMRRCRVDLPNDPKDRLRPDGSRACFMFCDGSMSQVHASVSVGSVLRRGLCGGADQHRLPKAKQAMDPLCPPGSRPHS